MATDLKAFQKRLNSDTAFRAEFLKDPVKALEDVGLLLPDAAKKHLTELVRQFSTKPSPREPKELGIPDIQIIIKPKK